MPNLTAIQVPPPSDWQAFQRLCRSLWERLFENPTVQQYGGDGQAQRGVDVVGVRRSDGKTRRHPVQAAPRSVQGGIDSIAD